MKKRIGTLTVAIIVLCSMNACFYSQPIVRETPQNNQTYKVDYLFEYEGCKVYRFYDDWAKAYVYFTNCRSDVTAIRNDSTRERTQNSVRITYDDYKQLNGKSK
ncbi:MAG TPA: DUF4884 domain-containing protein [Porphyromonadaceae bacterium]|jgi:hypothetical protein|nr:DUF4884 domain-containing protein [Porphyromonadaceae bacterium]HBX21499.1 DUF4884 domain-containing protein [Porphyromonadaceae bacterium]HCM21078.1 hypothetical protein [Porphyromonadaceae bacterium]